MSAEERVLERRKSFRGDVDLVLDAKVFEKNSKIKKRHSFRGDVDVKYETKALSEIKKEKKKKKKRDSLDHLMDKKEKKRGGSMSIKRKTSFLDRFKRSKSHDTPKTHFAVMYDIEDDNASLSQFRQRRKNRDMANNASKWLELGSVTLTLENESMGDSLDRFVSTSHLAKEVARIKFEETEKTILDMERKKKEKMKKKRKSEKKKTKAIRRRRSHHA
jgi:hypothetical protein